LSSFQFQFQIRDPSVKIRLSGIHVFGVICGFFYRGFARMNTDFAEREFNFRSMFIRVNPWPHFCCSSTRAPG